MKESCYFIGIGGIGMSGLAQILLEKKVPVSGSDLSSNALTLRLEQKGAQIYCNHLEQNIHKEMTVVYSSSISKENPEYQTAVKLGCPLLHRSDVLVALMKGYKTLAVAGTHGKTTTSSLLTAVAKKGGLDPAFAVGGMITQYGTNASHGSGEYFVAEADESDGTFLKYLPFAAIITNIGFDHLLSYGSCDAQLKAFHTFANKTAAHLFWCGDDPVLQGLMKKGISYGFGKNCQLRVENDRQIGWKTFFDFTFEGKIYKEVELALVGKHNILNAAAVFGLALTLGIREDQIRTALATFEGIKRRCEKKWEKQEILFLDDYAHHPTEIKTTLTAIRNACKERPLIAVYQPHRYSRIKDCLDEFSGAFDAADLTIVTEVCSAGEAPLSGISHETILKKISGTYVPRNLLKHYLQSILHPHDVVVSLGAGDITKLADELSEVSFQKWKIGVIAGGGNIEHEISLLSAANIQEALNNELYEIIPIPFEKENAWKDNVEILSQCDIIFPAVHGPGCEDGILQGFLETLDLPYIGPGVVFCALCMDKSLTKLLMLQHGILTSPFIDFSLHEWETQPQHLLKRIEESLNYPLFVKGVHGGSSVGVSQVLEKSQLLDAIHLAFRYDDLVIVENGIQGRELEFAVFGNDEITVLPPGEILSQKRIYDYEAKYGNQGFKAIPQAPLTEELLQRGMELAKRAYRIARCKGLTRVDFFLDESGQYWLNEMNTMPGFTNISLFPMICNSHGISTSQLLDKLVILSLQRNRNKKTLLQCR